MTVGPVEIPVRIRREKDDNVEHPVYENVCITTLTGEEVTRFFAGMDPVTTINWIKAIIKLIQGERELK